MKLVFVLLLAVSLQGAAQRLADPYDFPVKPGSEAWQQLQTGKEMMEVCQIPETVLKSLTTEALAITCMNYPLYGDYNAIDDVRIGISKMIDNFNGLKELSLRSDGAQKLMEIYAGSLSDDKKLTKDVTSERPVLKENYLELLLSSPVFYRHLDENKKNELAQIALRRYEEKRTDIRFGNRSKKISLLLSAQMIQTQATANSDLQLRSQHYSEQFPAMTSVEEMENFYQLIKNSLP